MPPARRGPENKAAVNPLVAAANDLRRAAAQLPAADLPAAALLGRLLLVMSNLLPLGGVLLYGWDVRLVLLTYWSENVVIGFFTACRILVAGGIASVPLAAFFLVHYGIFTFVHGVFVVVLPSFGSMIGHSGGVSLLDEFDPAEAAWALLLPVLALAVSHGVSFVADVGSAERRPKDPNTEMGRPYGRMIVLHLALLFGGFAVVAIGSPVVLLVLLVVLKAGWDLWAGAAEASGSAANAN